MSFASSAKKCVYNSMVCRQMKREIEKKWRKWRWRKRCDKSIHILRSSLTETEMNVFYDVTTLFIHTSYNVVCMHLLFRLFTAKHYSFASWSNKSIEKIYTHPHTLNYEPKHTSKLGILSQTYKLLHNIQGSFQTKILYAFIFIRIPMNFHNICDSV